jgi:hypothetical protein
LLALNIFFYFCTCNSFRLSLFHIKPVWGKKLLEATVCSIIHFIDSKLPKRYNKLYGF